MSLNGIGKCSEKLCKCCDNIIEVMSVEFIVDNDKMEFVLKHNFNCMSKNVIYKLQC